MTSADSKKVAKKLKSVRVAKGLTQAQVAEKAGMNANAYAKIERGERVPNLETLGKIVKALRVKSSDVLPF